MERVMVGSGANRGEHFVGFCRRKDELHVLGRLFNDFEKRIEALLGDHMGLIEDEDFVAVSGGSKDGSLPQLPRIIDSVVTGGVNFDDIQRTAAVIRQLHTTRAGSTRSIGRALVTVPAFGKNPRRGGLSTSPGA